MATANEKKTKYVIRKSNDGSGKVVVSKDGAQKNATFYKSGTLLIATGNNEVLYADGVNISSITLKDKNASVYYEDGKPVITIGDKSCDPNSSEGKKILAEVEKICQESNAFATELTKVPALKNHRWTKSYIAATQDKFAKRVDARQASKKAKQRVEGRRGATEVEDPNLVVANGGTPTYSASYAKPKAGSRVTSKNIPELAAEAVNKAKEMTEDQMKEHFDNEYGEGAVDALIEAKKAEIAAKRMKAQKGR